MLTVNTLCHKYFTDIQVVASILMFGIIFLLDEAELALDFTINPLDSRSSPRDDLSQRQCQVGSSSLAAS
jgi:hypothetical protein